MSSKTANQGYYSTWTIILMYIVGATIRYWLTFSRYQSIIGNHIEVSTPLNSWKRVSEGLYLQSKGIDPYDGDLLHEAPITMWLYKTLIQTWQVRVDLMFIIVDMMTALCLYFASSYYMFLMFVRQEENKEKYLEESRKLFLTARDFANVPVYVLAAFLFNPYTIFNCVGHSTTVFHNFFMAFFLLAMVHGDIGLSAFCLAACAGISFYPVVLIIPLFLNFVTVRHNYHKAVATVLFFVLILYAAEAVAINISGGRGFIRNVYVFILTVPDLQPNIGLFWYFFTEMFDHFRDLFIYSFQINATVLYLIPLSIRFRQDPFLLTTAILFLISIFKSYPCVGDVGFVLSLIPCFTHFFNYSQQAFLVGVIFLITNALGPILWYLWIYSNSANANFYFGVTLAFAIAQIFLVTDILFAYLKREFNLKHGKERKIDGKDASLVLE